MTISPSFVTFVASLVVVGAAVPCVTTNTANTNCKNITNLSIRRAVKAWIANSTSAVIVWGNVTDW